MKSRAAPLRNLETEVLPPIEDGHEQLDRLMESLTDLVDGPGPVDSRWKLLQSVDRGLREAQRAEERSLYSRLDGSDLRVRQALSHHRHLERLLDELAAGDPATPDWDRKVWVLIWSAELHFQYEEDEIFELARGAADRPR